MDRNLLLAFIISVVIILGSHFLFPDVFFPTVKEPEIIDTEKQLKKNEIAEIDQSEKENSSVEKIPEIEKEIGTSELSDEAKIERKLVRINSPLYTAQVDTRNGVLKSFQLLHYKYALPKETSYKDVVFSWLFGGEETKKEIDPDRLVEMVGDAHGLNYPWRFSVGQNEEAINFQTNIESITLNKEKSILVLTAKLESGIEIHKEITFYPDSYLIDMNISVINRSGQNQSFIPELYLGAGNEQVEVGYQVLPKYGIVYEGDEFDKFDDDTHFFSDDNQLSRGLGFSELAWFGVMDAYFVSVAKLEDNTRLNFGIVKSVLNGNEVSAPTMTLVKKPVKLSPDHRFQQKVHLYIGPKEIDQMDRFDVTLMESQDLTFGFLAYPMLGILRWLQTYVHNWGVAIILLTIIVRVFLFPLALKGMLSMRKMSKLGPKMKNLKEKHKDDKERLNKEIMELYRRNKVNPMGGCFPLLMQIPIFIALYSALLPAIELRHQPFIWWIQDLSSSDHTLILPLAMGLSMFIQQKLTPMATMDPTQEKMMKWFPVLMIFFFLDFPTGLVLYWVVSNTLSIFQQVIFNKIKSEDSKDDLHKEQEKNMVTVVKTLQKTFGTINTGTIIPSLLEGIKVEYQGKTILINQVGKINLKDPESIVIDPSDKGMIDNIEEAILKSNLNLTLQNDGKVIRVTVPPINENHRKLLVKKIKQMGENCKLAIRSIHREGNNKQKKMEKNKEISKDEAKQNYMSIQKAKNEQITQIEQMVIEKEKELLP